MDPRRGVGCDATAISSDVSRRPLRRRGGGDCDVRHRRASVAGVPTDPGTTTDYGVPFIAGVPTVQDACQLVLTVADDRLRRVVPHGRVDCPRRADAPWSANRCRRDARGYEAGGGGRALPPRQLTHAPRGGWQTAAETQPGATTESQASEIMRAALGQ